MVTQQSDDFELHRGCGCRCACVQQLQTKNKGIVIELNVVHGVTIQCFAALWNGSFKVLKEGIFAALFCLFRKMDIEEKKYKINRFDETSQKIKLVYIFFFKIKLFKSLWNRQLREEKEWKRREGVVHNQQSY